MTDRSRPEATLERKLVALLAQCTEEEQSVFLTILEHAADEPEVEGFQAAVTGAVPSLSANPPQMTGMSLGMLQNLSQAIHDMRKGQIEHLRV